MLYYNRAAQGLDGMLGTACSCLGFLWVQESKMIVKTTEATNLDEPALKP